MAQPIPLTCLAVSVNWALNPSKFPNSALIFSAKAPPRFPSPPFAFMLGQNTSVVHDLHSEKINPFQYP